MSGNSTFCVGVAAPSVPARQFKTEFLFPLPPDMNSLKQALALITALQLSLFTSQVSEGPEGAGAANMVETKMAKRPNDARILSKIVSEVQNWTL